MQINSATSSSSSVPISETYILSHHRHTRRTPPPRPAQLCQQRWHHYTPTPSPPNAIAPPGQRVRGAGPDSTFHGLRDPTASTVPASRRFEDGVLEALRRNRNRRAITCSKCDEWAQRASSPALKISVRRSRPRRWDCGSHSGRSPRAEDQQTALSGDGWRVSSTPYLRLEIRRRSCGRKGNCWQRMRDAGRRQEFWVAWRWVCA